MAQKRMFDKRIIDTDKFMDLPNSSKALYFMAGMSADDRGFFQPRKLQKMCGFTDDDYKVLIAKNYFIPFESGVMVVTDWNRNNWLDSRRLTETEYIEELKLLKLINDKYELKDSRLAVAKQLLRENRIEENSIDKNSIEYKRGKFKKPTLEEIEEYIKEKNMNVNAKTFYDYFETSNWVDSKGNKVKNWKLKLITWNSYGKDKKEEPIWFDENIKNQEMTESEKKELENLLNDM